MSTRIAGLLLGCLVASTANAQTPAPTPPPAPTAPATAPPQYPYPYATPYQYPNPYAPPPPRELPYDEMKPIPPGYRIQERARKGPIIAGAIVLGVPYTLGLWIAAASDFRNHSYWLAVPAVGPLLTFATRDDACDEDRNNNTGENVADCFADAFVGMFLVFDTLMQTAGGAVLIYGLSSSKKVLVRQDVALTMGPRPVGSGYGWGVMGTF